MLCQTTFISKFNIKPKGNRWAGVYVSHCTVEQKHFIQHKEQNTEHYKSVIILGAYIMVYCFSNWNVQEVHLEIGRKI